ncbi:hypothetical protein EXS57_01715 [Candidatus Kaiserbacteria bacterium]|nr:hypothetical protein [Candidatus Kaiserbacteria bacterium]
MQRDVTIIGCGVAGLHAAYPLVQAGVRVRMLDAGETPTKKFGWRYPLLGRRAGFARLRKEGERVIVESFVAGGLSEIWGGVCEQLNEEELRAAGLPVLDEHYRIVSERIGLQKGTLSEYRGHTTLEELKTYPNFEYKRELVKEIPHDSRFTVLACGAIGTARLLGKQTAFYKSNTLFICISTRRRPLGGLRPISAFSVGASYVLLYSILPYIVVADVRGPRVNLRQLGLWPLMSKRLPEGITSHYAGGVDVDSNGKFREGIYVADAAGWRALPAKPIAITIMANANRIGSYIAQLLQASEGG